MRLFVDTWGWIVLQNRRESRHEEAAAFFREFHGRKGEVYTTDYVLDETYTLLFKRLSVNQAHKALQYFDEATQAGYLRLEWITPARFTQAKVWRVKFQDKPHISFTDLTSMVVMDELGIQQVFTEDRHFLQVGKGFACMP